MKKSILILQLAIISWTASAQTQLWSMTLNGGANGYGCIFKMNLDGSGYTRMHDFDSVHGSHPYGSLIQASNGKLYGMTNNGGLNHKGVLFSFDTLNNNYTDLFDFDSISGSFPYGSLIEATNGKLYGMARNGGTDNYGVIFSFNPSSNTFNLLYNSITFAFVNPQGSLIQATDGKLYGQSSPINSIFSFDLSSNIFTSVNFYNGGGPGSLMQAANGTLYGLASCCGFQNSAVLYSLNITSNTSLDLYEFVGSNGGYPRGDIIQASNGKLYGLFISRFSNYPVMIFSYDTASSIYTNIFMTDSVNGNYPYGSLFQATNGKLYGMTALGGINNKGVIFNYDINTGTYSKLRDLNLPDGINPYHSNFIELGNNPTNVNNLALLNSITISPNPFSSFTNISFSSDQKNTTINITDILGKEVKTIHFSGKECKIDKEEMKKGVYLVKIIDNQNNIINRKMIIQ